MQFSIATLTAALAITGTTSAFVIDIFPDPDCGGEAKSVNVWDNTCATWMGGFTSFKPTGYGGPHQKGYFFVPGNCGDLTTSFGQWWVDGGDSGFQVGGCINAGSGRTFNAVASYSG